MKVIKASKKVAINAKYPSDLRNIFFELQFGKIDQKGIHVKLDVYADENDSEVYNKVGDISDFYPGNLADLVVTEVVGALHSGGYNAILEGSKIVIADKGIYGLVANDLIIVDKENV